MAFFMFIGDFLCIYVLVLSKMISLPVSYKTPATAKEDEARFDIRTPFEIQSPSGLPAESAEKKPALTPAMQP